ncbi:C39 family peptidase [Anaerotignum sp.]
MIRHLMFLGLVLLGFLQLFTLFFGRRKKRGLVKRVFLSFAACLLVYHFPSPEETRNTSFTVQAQIGQEIQKPETYPEYIGTETQIVYYNQEDLRWGEKTYGPVDKISDAGCGPTVLAMAVSSFTENEMNPKEMCDWAYVNGYCSVGSGSYHTLIAQGLECFGIDTRVTNSSKEVEAALESGNPVIALMGEGHFTSGGHFILLCEIDEDGKVTVADPKSVERTNTKWEFDIIAEEAKMSPAAGGAYWILEV